jgi:integrase
MRRTDPKTRQRDRVLSDDELREIWRAAEENGTFGAVLRILLLTVQRRKKVISMRWQDLAANEWSIPTAPREKGTGGILVLPDLAMDIIQSQPRFASNPYVFAGRGAGYFNGFSKAKRALDAKLPRSVDPWAVHDLRRTARSLMSRAGVRPQIAERVMGHALAGVEGVYDRHSYRTEKGEALNELASLLRAVINMPARP